MKKTLKNLTLFEDYYNFKISDNTLFAWMPYVHKMNSYIHDLMPKEDDEDIPLNEVLKIIKNMSPSELKEAEESGLFMAHEKISNGFVRFFIMKFSPEVMFDIDIFNDDYEQREEYKNVKIGDINIDNFLKGASLLSDYGLF